MASINRRLMEIFVHFDLLSILNIFKHIIKFIYIKKSSTVMKFPGIHGATIDKDNESHHPYSPSMGIRLQFSGPASEFGKLCSKKSFEGRRAVTTWEPCSTSAGCAGLFDPRLGGDCVLNLCGVGKRLRPGDKIYRQHAHSSTSERAAWFGSFGYRSISGYEPYRADLGINRVKSTRGPWLLLPSSPKAHRHHSKSIEKVILITLR